MGIFRFFFQHNNKQNFCYKITEICWRQTQAANENTMCVITMLSLTVILMDC